MQIKQDFLTVNNFSRPARRLKGVHGIVVHWVANPKSTAQGNRNYFENLKNTALNKEKRYASAHFVIGLEGEIIQCIPENEMAYHVGANVYKADALKSLGTAYPNDCTLGIELCHPEWDGKFNDATLDSCRDLVSDLLERHGLTGKDIYRHFDITGKDCPHYFVQNEDEWKNFIERIG